MKDRATCGAERKICLYGAIFIYFLSAYMYVPFFSLYVREMGGSYVELAAVLSVTGFVLSLIQSYIGYLSDKMGAYPLILGGSLLSSAGLILTGLTYRRSCLLPLYLLANIGMGILAPSVFALISYQKTRKGESFIPVYRSIQGAGVILGPLLGGWAMKHTYRGSVLGGGILMLSAALLFGISGKGGTGTQAAGQKRQKQESFWKSLREVWQNQSFLAVMLLFTFAELAYDLIYMSLPIVGAELNFRTEITGTALSAYYLMFTLFQLPINRALRKMKRRSALMLMGGLSLIPCALFLTELPDFSTIFIMGAVGLTIGSLFTFCSVMAEEECPPDRKGMFLGVFNTIMPFTDVVSPFLVAALVGVEVKLPYAAAAALMALFVLTSFRRKKGIQNGFV